ncbi:MAG: AbrB/MazE/SpoVT family DNA-binding domain-containing protein [Candidatus Helarchaeota archaeon]
MTRPIRTKLSKGFQTVLPAEIREKLKVLPGDDIIWSIVGDEVFIRVKKRRIEDPIRELIGKFSTEKDDNATENIDKIINES